MKNKEQKQVEDRMKAFEKNDTPPIEETPEQKKERTRVRREINKHDTRLLKKKKL